MIKRIVWAALPMLVVFIYDNLVNVPLGFYEWWWFDIFMHMFGGLVTAWSAHRFFKSEKISVKPNWLYGWLVIGTTAVVGIAWEVYEFYFQKITGFITQPSIADTVADLVNDCVGALFFVIIIVCLKVSNRGRD